MYIERMFRETEASCGNFNRFTYFQLSGYKIRNTGAKSEHTDAILIMVPFISEHSQKQSKKINFLTGQ